MLIKDDEVYIGPYEDQRKDENKIRVEDIDLLDEPGSYSSESLAKKTALVIKYSGFNVGVLKDFIKIDVDSLKINESEFENGFLQALISKNVDECNKYFTYYSMPRKVRLKVKREEELLYLSYIFSHQLSPVFINSIEKFRDKTSSTTRNNTEDLISVARFAIDNNIKIHDFYEGQLFDVGFNLEEIKAIFNFRKDLENILNKLDLSEEHFLAYKNINGNNFSSIEDLKSKLKIFIRDLQNDISPLRTLTSSQIIRLYDQNDPILIEYATNILSKVHVFDDVSYSYYDGCYYSLYCISKQDGLMIEEDKLLPLYLTTKQEGRMPYFEPDGRYHIAIETAHELENGLEYLFMSLNPDPYL